MKKALSIKFKQSGITLVKILDTNKQIAKEIYKSVLFFLEHGYGYPDFEIAVNRVEDK